jgi:hypothetical protein
MKALALGLLLTCALAACSATPSARTKAPETGPVCEAKQRELLSFVEKLPAKVLIAPLSVELPECAVGDVLGGGALLEVSERAVLLEGEEFELASLAERAARVRAWFEQKAQAKQTPETVYVAAPAEIDVQTLRAYLHQLPESLKVRLLVRVPAAAATAGPETSRDAARAFSARLLAEREPRAREELARAGYAEFASCAKVSQAVHSVDGLGARERWPRLREAMRQALPGCKCGELDAEGMKQLLSAEQRAGAATLAALPIGFLRDERCGASMPLRSLGKLLKQIEDFDREFAGDWQKDALAFEQVLTSERLVGYFCNALPGETLAALARARATLYWKVPGSEACEAWRFEPLSPGAPMGTWRRLDKGSESSPEFGFHYWQAAEEVRLFGPTQSNPPSKPTDHHEWACDQSQRLLSVDARSIELEHGRWFFSDAACRSAHADNDTLTGCTAQRGAR